MSKVIQTAAAVVAIFTMTACGGGICERVDAASTKFYAGKTECKYSEGGTTVTLTKGSSSVSTCNMSVSKCTSADNTILESYAKCVEAAPACATGAEKAAADAMTACALQLINVSGGVPMSKLSADCANGFK
ncbi:MAG: hypothetical protein IAE78_20990 [Myxococcus sp.]|nr:hypothetical protein [Myxococcus sp.]